MSRHHDLFSHPFSSENIAYETGTYVLPSDKGWNKYVASVKNLLGHIVDGNDPEYSLGGLADGDGYSLDECYEMFENGTKPEEYVAIIKKRDRYKKPE